MCADLDCHLLLGWAFSKNGKVPHRLNLLRLDVVEQEILTVFNPSSSVPLVGFNVPPIPRAKKW